MNLPMRRPLPAAIPGALLVSVLLAACAGPPPPEVAARVDGARVDGASLAQPMRSAATATDPTAPAPNVAALPVPAPSPASGPRWANAPKPGAIINHPGATVRSLLGAPALRRREPPAEVWQYSGAGCVLDITFYPAKDGGPARAAYLESRSLDGATMEPSACLNGMAPPRR